MMHMRTDLAAFSRDVREIAVRSLARITGCPVLDEVQTKFQSHPVAPGGGLESHPVAPGGGLEFHPVVSGGA